MPKIKELLAEKKRGNIAILFSGDTGFYSAAEKLGAVLERRGNYTVEVIPGISSVGYFFAKIRRPWDHAKLFKKHI